MREEADTAITRAEEAESKNKRLEQELLEATQANEGLTRKVARLEEELDAAESNLKETTEKLQTVDVRAETFERQVTRLEQERDQMEAKADANHQKYLEAQKELEGLVAQMESL